MSYDKEREKIIARCKQKMREASEAGKNDTGRDGMESKLLHEAIAEYNQSLLALKKKYGKD